MLIRRQPSSNAEENSKCVEFKYATSASGVSIPDGFGIEVEGGRRRLADLEMEFGRFVAQAKEEPGLVEMFDLPVLQEILREIVSPGLFGRLGWPAHYLPAGRAAFFDSFDTVVGSLIDQASTLAEIPPPAAGVNTEYEKFIVKKGELLIVDEPESHLHPALQVELIRQLANLVNEGKRVIVTTHSEWISEELANIVRRSKLEGRLARVAEPKPGIDETALPEADVNLVDTLGKYLRQ